FVLDRPASLRDPHSFPTRRSSDLDTAGNRAALGTAGRDVRGVRYGRGQGVAGLDGGVYRQGIGRRHLGKPVRRAGGQVERAGVEDRKSTRLNSSHDQISYAVFCLK